MPYYILHFLCLPKENEAKERAACLLVRQGRIPCAAQKELTIRKVAKFIPPSGVLRRIV
jgi:hypothetical protein